MTSFSSFLTICLLQSYLSDSISIGTFFLKTSKYMFVYYLYDNTSIFLILNKIKTFYKYRTSMDYSS